MGNNRNMKNTIKYNGKLNAIGNKIKDYRIKNKMTQKELAERTGIRPPTVSAICTGTVKHLPVDALDKICKVLDCQPGDLLEYVKEVQETPDKAQ